MLIRRLEDCHEFCAEDGTLLREMLHPAKAVLALRYSLAHAVVRPGEASVPHKLRTSEVYYIPDGQGVMHINEEAEAVSAGMVIYIPPSATQYIQNTGPNELKFLCIVDPAWRQEDAEILY